ncbi:MAG: S41 family peptidase [Flavobacteriales bacterium]|nr:S41 family peptidase [Flavobacteriales bacterium]
MKRTGAPITPFVPLLLSLALVAGLFIGHGMQTPSERSLGFLFTRKPSPTDKIGQVLDLIDRQYVDSVAKKQLVDEVLADLLQRLDPHSYYISAEDLRAAKEPLEGSFDGIGVEFNIQRDTVVVIAPVEGGPSAALGIRPGDRILAANDKTLAGVGVTNKDVMDNLRGPGGTEVTVSILRPGSKEPFPVTIKRGKIPINSVAVSLLEPDGTGLIKLVRFARTTHEEFVKAARTLKERGMKRLVLDLRGNGGGYLDQAILLTDELLPPGRLIVYTEGRHHPRRDQFSDGGGLLEDMPLAVLIDEGSASASEIVAGALQDNDRGVIVGRRTFGKGLVQDEVMLPDSSAVRLTTARYYTPSGRSIQRPYGEGIDYGDDFAQRFAHGELLSADSIQMDSTQAFRTRSGRVVYGGGGVMPDVFVPADTAEASGYMSELFYTGVLNQFAFAYADRNRARLERLGGAEAFAKDLSMDEALLTGLVEDGRQQGIPPDRQAIERSRRMLVVRLKATVARHIWGNEAYYALTMGTDHIYQQARSALAGSPQQ